MVSKAVVHRLPASIQHQWITGKGKSLKVGTACEGQSNDFGSGRSFSNSASNIASVSFK
jgi:hypothetical protein